MILDTKLEQYPATVVNNTSVNPQAADSYLPLLQPDGIHTYLASVKPNGGALWKIARPLLPNNGQLGLQFNWVLSAEALLYGRCFEFDTRPTDVAGWTYPLDFQFVLLENMLRLNVATGVAANKIVWQDTGQAFTCPGQGQLVPVDLEYSFDITKRVCSILWVSLGTAMFNIPAALRNQPAVQLGWQVSQVVLQKQMEVGVNGGVSSDTMSAIQYSWS